MTTPRPDDDQRLPDRQVDAAWRAASAEEPPAALDAAILAAARREVGAGPQRMSAAHASHARRMWWPLAAAATIGVIAFGLLQLVPQDPLGAPGVDNAVVSDVPATVAKRPAETFPSKSADTATPVTAAPAAKDQLAPRRTVAPSPPSPAPAVTQKRESAADRRDVAAAAEPFPAAPPRRETATPAPAEPAPERAAARVAEPAPLMASPPAAPPPATVTMGTAAPAPPPATAQMGAAAPAPARQAPLGKATAERASDSANLAMQSRAADRPPLPAADWITLIRRLRDDGKTDEAAKELAAFRAVHADHERLLPPDLRDWRPPAK